MTMCVGPEFDVEPDGSLVLRLAGAPAESALPTSGNGMRLDPTKGLWVPAEHTAVQISSSRTESPGNRLVKTGNNFTATPLTVTVVNPSPTRPLLCFFTVEHAATFNIAAAADDNAGYTGWQLLGGLDIDGVPSSGLPTRALLTRRDQGVEEESGYTEQAVQTGHMVIAPGGTGKIRASTGVACFQWGYVRVVHLYETVRGIGVTQ